LTAKDEKQQALKALAALGNRVTVTDVAAQSGMSLEQSSKALNAVAAKTNANLQVTALGDVHYQFPSNYHYIYFSSGIKGALLKAGAGLLSCTYYLFRISFGLMLLASLSTAFGTVLLFQSAVSILFGATQTAVSMWKDFFALIRTLIHRSLSTQDKDTSGTKPNFLTDCYSFLFGEGNPNETLEEERKQAIAQVIRLNEGVVLQEHLSPYTGKGAEDERTLFSILRDFDGMPRVTDSGNIVYIFPKMQTRSNVANYAFVPAQIEERYWLFSQLDKSRLKAVVATCIGNFLACSMCAFVLLALGHYHIYRLSLIFLTLTVFASLFLIVPMLRLLVIRRLNSHIEERNAVIRAYERLLGNPSAALSVKLDEAERIRTATSRSADDKIVYSTDKDYLEQISDSDFFK